ncbi:MAG: hypothetical protein RBQ71_02895 [Acholeplasmataceae bacterium]|jgi:hypothetical protein|nr:hypothetical protein [Acholeplasmataceae bacterium]
MANYRPGQISPKSGQYQVISNTGNRLDREITSVKGTPLPPTQQPGQTYKLVDATKHKK